MAKSEKMVEIFRTITKIAEFKATVLITGRGAASARNSSPAPSTTCRPRKDRPFVAVNCGGDSGGASRGELFGHKKGAASPDASSDRRGLFEEASDGTLLLDEIGELPLALYK